MFLDTNAAFLPLTHGVDLEREVDRLIGAASIEVPSSVRRELDRLRSRQVAHVAAALALVDRFPTAPNTGTGDSAILALARDAGAWVITADQELRIRLTAAGVGVLYPRDRSRLGRAVGEPRRAARRRRPPPDSGNG